MTYANGALQHIDMELTTRCNAACPMCARNLNGGIDNPDMPLINLSLTDIQRILPAPWTGMLQTLDAMQFCGNYGDPILAPDLLPIITYLRSIKPTISFAIHTNGSLRTTTWWATLAQILNRPADYVTFGIDGLADTNHLHRRHTDFDKIMNNAQAFINAGGHAHWTYLVFQHNEHQVAEAEALACEMGFMNFKIKKTPRFSASQQHVVMDRQNRPIYSIMPSRLDIPDVILPGRCKSWDSQSIYITAEGLVFPCCWMGHLYNDWQRETAELLDEVGGRNVIDAKQRPIEDIVNGAFFDAVIRRWSGAGLRVCARKCGVGLHDR